MMQEGDLNSQVTGCYVGGIQDDIMFILGSNQHHLQLRETQCSDKEQKGYQRAR